MKAVMETAKRAMRDDPAVEWWSVGERRISAHGRDGGRLHAVFHYEVTFCGLPIDYEWGGSLPEWTDVCGSCAMVWSQRRDGGE